MGRSEERVIECGKAVRPGKYVEGGKAEVKSSRYLRNLGSMSDSL